MNLRGALLGIALLAAASGAAGKDAEPERWTIFATRSGQPAMDGDQFGGNPFASALVQELGEELRDGPGSPFSDLADGLREKTIINSFGRQQADVADVPEGQSLLPEGKAVALVIVISDYGNDEGMASLPGAAFDAERMRVALAGAGFAVQAVNVRSREEYRRQIAAFSARSAKADMAVLYTTGHGMELDGEIWMLPPEYNIASSSTLDAINVRELQASLKARRRNVLFYAGCRDNAFRPVRY